MNDKEHRPVPFDQIVVWCGRCKRRLPHVNAQCQCKRRPPRGPRYEGPMRA